MMQTETLLTLPEELTILPVAELDDETRSRLDCEPEDFAVSLPRSRTTSVIVDPHTAGLLERFRQPRSLVDAVLLYSLPRQLEAREVLEASMPVVEGFLRRGLLIDAENPETGAAVRPSFVPGDRVERLTVVRSVQLLADTELYLVRLPEDEGTRFGALKLRRDVAKKAPGSLRREGEVLDLLDGRGAPRLLRRGEIEGRPYLLIEWCDGVDGETAAREWRERGRAGRRRLLALTTAIAGAYAELHRRGVLHGDVHPRNVLVDAAGGARLIDFGLARRVVSDPGATGSEPGSGRRPGVAFYFEPEHARALLDDGRGRPVTAAGEQYAVAALLYRLMTGSYTCDFRLERRAMLRQLAEEPPLPFAERGVEPWAEVEAVLGRALARQPEERFPSMAELADALAAVRLPTGDRRGARTPAELTRRSVQLLRQTAADGPWLAEGLAIAPTAAVVHGGAGVACGLLRIASRRDDPELLALADRWSRRAAIEGGNEAGFANPEVGIDRELVGHFSPYHTLSGVHAVAALVARARGDHGGWRRSALGFAEAVERGLETGPENAVNPDLTLGRSGVLLLAALLGEGMPAELRPAELTALAERQLAELTARFDRSAPIGPTDNLAVAHGWAGMLYAALQWCRTTGTAPPAGVERRLVELAALAEPAGRGIRWPWLTGGGKRVGYMPGWCNGSAGFVFLWTLAWRTFGAERFLDLATGAAWDAWEAPDRVGSLCCGLVGRAYALLNLHRHTGERVWLARGRDLAVRAAREESFSERFPHSLYKGDLGLAVLAADLERPEEAAMPFFEEERWDDATAPADARSEDRCGADPTPGRGGAGRG